MDDLITTKQAAILLDIKPQTLRKWRMKGKGPRAMAERGLCNRVQFTRVSIVRFMRDTLHMRADEIITAFKRHLSAVDATE